MVLTAAALLGLVLGSFVTMLSWRLPRGLNPAGTHSHCPKCGHDLGLRDLVPLLSWLSSGGRCRHCGAAIGWRYPAIEAVMAGLALLVAWRFGPSWMGLSVLALATVLLAEAVIDLEHGIIPDVLQLAAAALGLVALGLNDAWAEGGIGAALGLGIGLVLRYGFRAVRGRHGLGLGDVKFLGVAGLWLGAAWLPAFFVVSGLAGAVLGLAWRRLGRGATFPFGPALAAGLMALVLWPR